MKRPEKYKNIKIEPLLIYWMPISNNKNMLPFFKVPLSIFNNPNIDTSFTELNIFSVSIYLRELIKKTANMFLDVEMPNVDKRIEILNDIIVS